MSKKTKTTSQSTQTTTPNNPKWVEDGLSGVGAGLQKLMGQDPKSFVAGPSALQTKAYQDAGNLNLSPLYGQAQGMFNDIAGKGANTYQSQGYTASSLLDGLDKYMSPYTNDVVNSALSDFDYGAGQTRANQALDEARSGAFGGSGAAITRSMTEGELARGRAATSANLRDLGFQRGAGLSAQDAGFRNQAAQFNAAAANQAAQYNAGAQDTALARQMQAAGALAGLGSTMGADQRANIALTGSLGQDQRAIEQQQAAAPLSVLQSIAGTYGGMPLNLLNGSTTTGSSNSTSKTSDPWGTFANLLGGAGSVLGGLAVLSDRRLKTDIEKVGEREDGLGVYAFRYLWSPVRHIGVMAQEVLNVKPEAVVHLPGGYMAVNYGAL